MEGNEEYLRSLLKRIKAGLSVFVPVSNDDANVFHVQSELSQEEADNLRHHLDLAEQEGFIEVEFRTEAGVYHVRGLTQKGHDFLMGQS